MKKILSTTTYLIIGAMMFQTSLFAQQKASPPKVSQATINGNEITINYSSPSKKGREIYGGLVPNGKIWRTGANEATTIELSKDGTIGGVSVKAGKYAIFTIPGKEEWTVIINSNAKQWGAYKYDETKDVGRFTTNAIKLDEVVEKFAIDVNDSGLASIMWDQTKVEFNIN